MSIQMEISGFKEIYASLAKTREKVGPMTAEATLFPAKEVLRDSQVIVPYKTGLLKSSGRVDIFSQGTNIVRVEVSYGKEPPVPYALIVHEGVTTHFVQRKKRQKQIAAGKGRQAKYLLNPFLKIKDDTADKIVRHIQITKLFS